MKFVLLYEPPYTERYVRWCEGTVDKLIVYLLLDLTNPSDPKDIADKIIYLLNNPNKIRKLGDRGRELIKEKYNWEAESKKLIILYNSYIK